MDFVGAGFCASLRSLFLCVCVCVFFFLASIFQTNGMFNPVFSQIFAPIFGQIFGAQIFVPIFAQIFGTRTFAQILRRFSADFSSTFWRLTNRCSRVTQKCAGNLRENLRRPNGPSRGGGVPYSISAFSSRQHVTQSPLGQHSQGEHVSVHRGIFGPKGMLAFAPRY